MILSKDIVRAGADASILIAPLIDISGFAMCAVQLLKENGGSLTLPGFNQRRRWKASFCFVFVPVEDQLACGFVSSLSEFIN